MSWEAENWARQQRTGDPVTKAVLVGIANWMNPRGDVCQVSIRRIADEVEVSTRTVQRHIQRLIELELVEKAESSREDGGTGWNSFRFPSYKPPRVSHVEPGRATARGSRKPGDNLSPPPDNLTPGHEGDNLTGGGCHPCHGGGDTAVRGESEERSRKEPPNPPAEKTERQKRVRGERISEGWSPPAIADLPPAARAKAQQWPDGAYEAEAEAFRDYWLGEGRAGSRKMDWNRTWYNRISEVTARVLRDARAGVKFDRVARTAESVPRITPRLDSSGECERGRAIRERLRKLVGPPLFDIWLAPGRFDVDGQTLTVTAPSDMASSYQRGNFDGPIRRAMKPVLGNNTELRWRVERPPEPTS